MHLYLKTKFTKHIKVLSKILINNQLSYVSIGVGAAVGATLGVGAALEAGGAAGAARGAA